MGAVPVEVGHANKVLPENIIGAITDKTAALLMFSAPTVRIIWVTGAP